MMILPLFLPSGGGGYSGKPDAKRVAVLVVVYIVWGVALWLTHTPVAESWRFAKAQPWYWVLPAIVWAVLAILAVGALVTAAIEWAFFSRR
jgi:hypothetical protein